ncbi:MAG TPA: ABC transporter permease [Brumimicrobium sp.]|nr:ABC transporter permease [Brumimicrobium sp.]
MYKIYNAIVKEWILLKRDLFGLIIIFMMPIILILTITPIQYSIESKDDQAQIPILLINEDDGELSKEMLAKLETENNIKFIDEVKGKPFSLEEGKKVIENGRQKVMLVIPEGFSANAQNKIDDNIARILSQVIPGYEEEVSTGKEIEIGEIQIFFDPIITGNIKSDIRSSIKQITSEMETEMIYKSFENEFEADLSFMMEEELVNFKEQTLDLDKTNLTPSPIQHNMPAWALFAMFLIVVPLSINMVKEKNQGTYIRLKTLPVSSLQLIASKIIVYLIVCVIQFYLMLLVSIYVFPMMGMPALQVSGKMFYLFIVAVFSGLAAVGFGVLIGTVAKTLEQSAPFGSTAVVILAAIGGLWFPVYAMSESMQKVARISPMNWGLEGFYHVLLRDTSFISILPYLSLLLLFFILNIVIAVIYEKKVNTQI